MLSIAADTAVVPLASEEDAATTCEALADALDPGSRIVLVHVIEKAGGAPDKASVEQREERAAAIFDAGRASLGDADHAVETELVYGTDVADAIGTAATDLDADAIVLSPRKAGRLSRLLTGDTALDLLTDSPVPLVVLQDSDG